jgi:hypothetical protein
MKTRLGAAIIGFGVLATAIGMTGTSYALLTGAPLHDLLVAVTTGGCILAVVGLVSRYEDHAQIHAQQVEAYSHLRREHLQKTKTTLSGATTA